MLTKAFLSPAEIEERIAQEAASDKDRKLTPEQIEAIYSNGTNILVSASAGSGKTFVMVERILDMIGRGVGIDQLFISTFTVKAAGELKERLEKRLTKHLGQAETDEERAFLSDQIAKIGTADIGTMDAFTQKLVNQYGYLLGVSPIFRIMTDPAEQTLMKNEVYADLFNDYMQGKDAQLFQKLVRNFTGHSKTSKAFRDLVYDIYSFSQATADPEKWLRQNLLKGQIEAKPEQAKNELLDSLKDGLLADFLAFLRDHLGIAQREFAKAKYLNNVSDAIILLEGSLINDQTDMEDLLKQLLTLSGGTGLTNMTRPKDEELKAYKEAYNKTKNEFVAQLREVDTQLTVLEVWPSIMMISYLCWSYFSPLYLIFRISIYRQRFRKIPLNSRILPTLLSVFWKKIQRWQSATGTVTMKLWWMSIRTIAILKNECWNFYLTAITDSWWEISSSPFIVSVRQTLRFLMISFSFSLKILMQVS